jgi:hypothetical protein
VRWDIEAFLFTLKEGCRVEALQLGRIERIERALSALTKKDLHA